jgi:hypothetical protein
MLFTEVMVVYCENHKKCIYIYILGKINGSLMLKQVVYIVTSSFKMLKLKNSLIGS